VNVPEAIEVSPNPLGIVDRAAEQVIERLAVSPPR
jgi:hypothetical protein